MQGKHGESAPPTPEYRCWIGIRSRCKNPRVWGYSSYGGRGITVCERWMQSYETFLSDMGRKPSPKHSIDRIDNNGNYEPGNCRWATQKEQNANRPQVRPPMQKLTPDQVRKIRVDPRPQRAIAASFGIDQTVVSEIKRRKAWIHVQD